MKRLALSQSDKAARDWFISTTEELSCTTKIDAMGNIFAIRPGLNNDEPPTYAGSHLDTQPSGGRYDGILGVTAGIEMLRVLKDNWVETEFPVGVVNWTKYVLFLFSLVRITNYNLTRRTTAKKARVSQSPWSHLASGLTTSPSPTPTT
jgi:hypothetical protein